MWQNLHSGAGVTEWQLAGQLLYLHLSGGEQGGNCELGHGDQGMEWLVTACMLAREISPHFPFGFDTCYWTGGKGKSPQKHSKPHRNSPNY